MPAKILLVVEGERAEPRLLRRLLEAYGLDADYEIVPYGTNVHVLYDDMFANGAEADVLSLPEVLKEREDDPAKRAILDQDFSDILLVFDYEPHDDRFDPEHLLEMQHHFNESTDEGKLFINYPMVEACRHFACIPDPGFAGRRVSVGAEVPRYKEIVGRETCCQNVSRLDKEALDAIVSMTLSKSLGMCGKDYAADAARASYGELDLDEVLARQNELVAASGFVEVLGTCVLFICDYSIGLVDFI